MDALTLNGQTLAYRHRAGRGGPTVVFVNSLGSDQCIWDDVIACLPRGFETLTYDLRGHGHSGASHRHSIRDLADDLAGLIDALNLSDIILCGLCMGGMVAQDLTARRPDLIAALILANTATCIGQPDRWNARIKDVREKGLQAIAPQALDLWFAPDFPQEKRFIPQAMLSRTDAGSYIATCEAIRDADVTAAARRITVPTLCLAGSVDTSVTPVQVSALASSINDAKMAVIDGVAHIPCLEAPDAMAGHILSMVPKPVDRQSIGDATRRAVLGDAHVDQAYAQSTAFDTAFQNLITEGAWGTVWASPGLTHRERSMLTLALLAALGNFDEIPMHVRATARTGASETDILEAFQHVAIYAGVPRVNRAIKLAKQTLAEMQTHDG